MTRLLSVTDLHVGFGRNPSANEVVRGVSFDLDAGQTLAIVGESGSGKSVTALSINRLVDFGDGRVTGGSIRFWRADGSLLDLTAATEPQLTKIRGGEIGMIFQEPMSSLNPVLTVGAQIAESFRLHRNLTRRQAMAAAKDALDRVRIPDAVRRLRYFPNQMSGGMLQRVMIATALACNPRLLIADEPTTALDVTVQAQIVALLADLQRETAMSMIFITHDIGLVAGFADKAMVMQAGQAVEKGDLDQILDRPSHAYTRHLLRAVPHFSGGLAARLDGPRAKDSGLAPVLDVHGLTVRFPLPATLLRRSAGAVHAVEDVSFDLMPGETLAIVGESGSGKSTTARSILGLIRSTRGTCSVISSGAASAKPSKAVQMVFQNPFASLNPRQRVDSILAEPVIAADRGLPPGTREKMAALLERVGLPENSLQRYPHEFSGGQRQRLCIARALMLNPTVLVLDEAVSALDVSVQATVLELLVDLQREFGLAYLFISHDMAVVERIAHRIAVVCAGQVVEIGAAAAILKVPQHSYTQRLIGAVPTVERRKSDFGLDSRPIPSLIHPPGYEPAKAVWKSFGADHLARAEVSE